MPHEHEYEDNSKGPKRYQIKLIIDFGNNVTCYYLKTILATSDTPDPEAVNLKGISQYKFFWTPHKDEALPLSSEKGKEITDELKTLKHKNRRYTVTHQ